MFYSAFSKTTGDLRINSIPFLPGKLEPTLIQQEQAMEVTIIF